MPFLSIIIPSYNSADTIIPLLSSIVESQKVDFGEIEIIVVDDCSRDETVEVVMQHIAAGPAARVSQTTLQNRRVRPGSRPVKLRLGVPRLRHPLPFVQIIQLKKNAGPAHGRNVGVKYARGRVVFFLDSDVVVYRNTLFELIRSFQSDQDLYALTGVWDKEQKTTAFFPKFKALRDWSYWINERDPKNYYYLFSTRVAAIDRELFLRLGGFDETYKAALVEDIELTYRIAKRHAVVFNPKVKVAHEFEDFIPVAKKYFWRSFYWSKIYRARKKFDPVATTSKEALTTVSAGGLIVSLFLRFIIQILTGLIGQSSFLQSADNLFFVLCYLFFVIHLWGVRKFIWFCIKEEGIIFGIRAFFTGILLYVVILAGAIVSLF